MKEEIEFYQKDEPRKFNLQNDLMDEFYYFLGYLTFRMNKFEKLLSYYLFLQENIKIADLLRYNIDFKRKIFRTKRRV
ncbi:unnamed protein product [Commensalibacter papalotli (ex Botero et al. 2024)]|nr:unnamed protein product [Commensalibacter papalotli (ex Botero et al. 2024)]CAI3926797.1 unnamed protein product [Commensalibacter papalotli (ex Botero et al. 2024)]